MSQLPVELYREISQYLKRDDLLSLVVVSRNFQVEAERLLYEIIAIDSNSKDAARRDVAKHCVERRRA
jgi:hypothetical protein